MTLLWCVSSWIIVSNKLESLSDTAGDPDMDWSTRPDLLFASPSSRNPHMSSAPAMGLLHH